MEFAEIVEGADIDASATSILGSANAITIDNVSAGFEYGWLRLNLEDGSFDANGNGVISGPAEELIREPLGNLLGLPTTGFAVQRFVNKNASPGINANYGGIFQHKGTRMTSYGRYYQ